MEREREWERWRENEWERDSGERDEKIKMFSITFRDFRGRSSLYSPRPVALSGVRVRSPQDYR